MRGSAVADRRHVEGPRNARQRRDKSEKATERVARKSLKILASPAGFEPTTPGLGILCSIRLSYGDGIAIYTEM